ncbi:MAG: FAD-binding oxidoreductase [Ktedonobacteraceae bacterium]
MHLSTQSLQSALEPFVGRWIRPAEDADTIAGVRPQVIVEPGNEEEVAAVLAFANQEGLRVLVRGGGTQLGLGFPPTGADILLSTTRLNQIVEHVPHDLVVTAQAGLPLATLQAALAQSKQWLALDPDLAPAATIGGIIATNATGPHRLRYGGVRDQIIGIRVVLADGTVAKGGGKVVKNVAGYDLPKLFTGALCTLGVIVSATFRLYPLLIASRTVHITASAITPLCDLAVRIIGSTLVPTVIDVLGDTAQGNTYTMVVRFEMGQEAVEAQAATLLEMVAEKSGAAIQATHVLTGEAEAQFWTQATRSNTRMNAPENTLTLKASLLPSDVAHWLTRLERVCQQQQLQATWRAHAGHGIIFVHLVGDDTALVAAVHELRQGAKEHRGSVVVTDAAPELTSRFDVWGPVPALDVMRNLKARFDPHNTLNPGRFVGGL